MPVKQGASKSKPRKKQQSKKTVKKADINRSWSILMFAVGAVVLALCFVQGQNAWVSMREFLFGVFGVTSYILGPILIYLAILTATNKPVRWKMLEAFVLALICSAFVQLFFSPSLEGKSFFEGMTSLYTQGAEKHISGGLISGILVQPMTSLFGVAPSKIVVVILGVVFFMFLFDITPYDVYKKTSDGAVKQKQELERSMNEVREARAESRQKRKDAQEQAAIEKQKNKKIDFDIDEPNLNQPMEDESSVEEQGIIIPVNEDYEKSFDTISQSNKIEQQKIEDIMKKLNIVSGISEATIDIDIDNEEANAPRSVGENIDSIVSKENQSLTKADQSEIKALSDMPQEAKVYTYVKPPITLFDKGIIKQQQNVEKELKTNAQLLVDTLASFGVKTKIIDISRGPSVTRYELQPLAGVKISKITSLADDIALNLASSGVRIEAPIPNKAAVGIEVPNKLGNAVSIRTILESKLFKDSTSPLSIALGVDIAGDVVVADLTKMPHLLIAGSTGSGKSVCVNSIITSFLYKSSPEEVKLILIDPKVVELAEYNGIPHLLMPVVTEPKKAAGALGSAVAEMEKRYKLFAQNSVRDIKTYNKLCETNQELEKIPYVAIIIDELADLMMVCGKEVEDYICRIAQKARAAGMHLIVATQRPSVDVITGLIKANIPARIAFAVSSQIDSRTILDGGGAERLLGMGDMLYLPLGASKPTRVQGTYVKDSEICAVINHVKQDYTADYDQNMINSMEQLAATTKGGDKSTADQSGMDEMLQKAIEVVVDLGQASTSLLQRKLKLGYARAARMMDEMEEMGIIGPYEGSKPRSVLMTKSQWLEMMINNE